MNHMKKRYKVAAICGVSLLALVIGIFLLQESATDTTHVSVNLYGTSLEPCQTRGDTRGSGDNEGKCSETDGGVHQICMKVDARSQNFAKDTGQGSNWSKERVGKKHCMCLGAWSLYKERQKLGEIPETSNELQCESISQISLSDRYTGKWNTWNGHEKPQQIVSGITQMVDQCYQRGKTKEQTQYLKDLYCDLTKDKQEFHNTRLYQQLC